MAGWILRYRHSGRRRDLVNHRFGPQPGGREAARPRPQPREWTVRDLAKATLAKKLVSLAHSTQVTYCRHLKREEPKLGALTVREIEASDVVALTESAGLTWGVAGLGLAR